MQTFLLLTLPFAQNTENYLLRPRGIRFLLSKCLTLNEMQTYNTALVPLLVYLLCTLALTKVGIISIVIMKQQIHPNE
jgi:hypothetical protein